MLIYLLSGGLLVAAHARLVDIVSRLTAIVAGINLDQDVPRAAFDALLRLSSAMFEGYGAAAAVIAPVIT